jgi:LysR family transcriptional regulator, regulator for genes of the gallate degradation pathway
VNLRHLHAFCESARRGSINAASRAVHLSQPAVTAAIAGVERFFGARLLTRRSQGVTPTAAGTACLARLERALDRFREGLPGRADRSITLSQLRTLVASVEHQSLAPAAKALGVSLPTVVRAVRTLERTVGTRLFERTSFGVRPTNDAARLARRASLAFAEITQAHAELAALRGSDTGRTVVGTMPLARSGIVPKALIAFTAEHPQHAVSVLEGPYADLLAALRHGRADVLVGALRRLTRGDEVVQEHLFDDPLAIVLRAAHPLAGRKRVRVEELTRYPWIAPRAESPLRAQFDDLFASAGVRPPRVPIECNSLVAARALLIESDSLMLSSARQVRYELAAGQLSTLPHPRGRVVRSIGVTVRRDWLPTRAQERLLALIRAEAYADAARLT